MAKRHYLRSLAWEQEPEPAIDGKDDQEYGALTHATGYSNCTA